MTLLVIGLLLWIGAHAYRRLAPAQYAGMVTSLGARPARGVFALLIVAGLILMIVGFRSAPLVPLWATPSWGIHLNNLLMLGAVFLFGMGHSKSRARAWLRHPMLTGVVVWGIAHLLVNGDLASLVLFGGLGLWALAEMALINASGPWVRPAPGTTAGDVRLVVIGLVIFAVITAVHTWLGYYPFPR